MNSPFYIVQDFLSGKQVDILLDKFDVKIPNKDPDGNNVKLSRFINSNEGQDMILNKLYLHIAAIEERYNCTYKGTEQLEMIHYPENDKAPAEEVGCENARFIKRKWVKVKDIDLTGFIWLKDHNEQPPLDPRYEIYGGKLEFPGLDVSLTPQRGTLVLYPAGPHFVNAISPIAVGDLYQIKINLSITDKEGGMWFYQPENFPVGRDGLLMSWFKEFL